MVGNAHRSGVIMDDGFSSTAPHPGAGALSAHERKLV
jgi:hypothetical protein